MPNYVHNRVKPVCPSHVEKLRERLLKTANGRTVTNFNGIIPMPEGLMNTTHTFESVSECMKKNRAKYGYSSWYDFAIGKWGTKWDNLNACLQDDVITFDSAWSIPSGIYSELASDIPLVVAYADEYIGFNVGVILFDGTTLKRINATGLASDAWPDAAETGDRYANEADANDIKSVAEFARKSAKKSVCGKTMNDTELAERIWRDEILCTDLKCLGYDGFFTI